ncbi:MAG TPA: CAP domain-containing protein [Steroidobacteraceae bacterium]|nr:CAP domain-containing protein [Steroidobacteraceae bacterium]
MAAWRPLFVCFAALLAIVPANAFAQHVAFDSLNAVRARGCDGKAGLARPFVRNAELERAALELSRGATLREAMTHLEHRLQHATSIVIRNASSEESRRRVLADEFCGDILDATLTLAGVVERDRDAWMVLGAPFETPSAADASAMNRRVLELINEARAHKRRCGAKVYQPAAPLKLAAGLHKAALRHARDMAAHSFLGHEGSDGTRAAQRATGAGYSWRTVGENVAAGSATPEQAVEDWLKSPGHCANLMNNDYTETGIAVVVNPTSAAGIYWAQVFAAPR